MSTRYKYPTLSPKQVSDLLKAGKTLKEISEQSHKELRDRRPAPRMTEAAVMEPEEKAEEPNKGSSVVDSIIGTDTKDTGKGRKKKVGGGEKET